MQIQVDPWQDLEKRFSIEIYVWKLVINLVVDVRVGESALRKEYPLEIINPFLSFFLEILTPWIRTMSPHLRVTYSSCIDILI